jgi:hypothetical protein
MIIPSVTDKDTILHVRLLIKHFAHKKTSNTYDPIPFKLPEWGNFHKFFFISALLTAG